MVEGTATWLVETCRFCPSFLSMLFCQGMERDQSYLWCGLSKSSQVRNRSDLFRFFFGNGGFLPFLIGIAAIVREVVSRLL